MITLIEQHVRQGRFDQALSLLPMLEQTLTDHPELSWALQSLQHELESHSHHTLSTLHHLKQVLVG